ncbi:tetratricopeptide repeat protein [uncultured Paracoccus sp.]|uniref:tetratricopeptide repeat protein n=1 Tax=uncultured Paracoccus sp. TaxID=189685 RepID=UPI0025FB391A|nr:tetratricopeptide repeat protein [uncultured Paracoccus sp.]
MSNQNDSFIDEVAADLRRDRLFGLLRRFGWIVVLLVLALVGGAAWHEYSRVQERGRAQDFGDAVLAAEQSDDPAAALHELAQESDEGRHAVATLLAAAALEADGQGPQAAQALRELASRIGGDDPVLRDLAKLKAVIAAGPALGAADRDTLLSELSQPGTPFELLALEQKALALVEAGRDDDAVTLIRQIRQKDGLSQGLRRRLDELMIVLGVDPEQDDAVAAADAAPTAD